MKLAALFTGGKDSTYAIYLAKKAGHEVACLITIKSRNPDSYMFHTPAIGMTKLQAEALGLPLIEGRTKGEKEKELADLAGTIRKARKKYRFEGLITGALFSEYQASRIEKIARKLGLKIFSPLWHKPPAEHMHDLIKDGFEFIFTGVAAEGLDQSWLNVLIGEKELEKLKKLNRESGLNVGGEGGEFESLVIDCPLFSKKLIITQFEVKAEKKNTARLSIRKARLERKRGKGLSCKGIIFLLSPTSPFS